MATASPILTFTGNALAETTMDFASWSEGKTQRARTASFQMGGKGVNVTKMLLRLGASSTALCFLGGTEGARCMAWLEEREMPHVAFPTAKATRAGLVVRGGGKAETTFLGPDAPPDEEAWKGAAAFLEGQADRGAVLAVCGSIPGWGSEESRSFREALERWLRAGKKVYADTYGAPLPWFAEREPELIKINAGELAGLLGDAATDSTERNLRLACERWTAKAWAITDGPSDLLLCEKGGQVERLSPPRIVEVSATGSGDVLHAGILHARLNLGMPLREAVGWAVPLAAANAAHPGIAEFELPPGLIRSR